MDGLNFNNVLRGEFDSALSCSLEWTPRLGLNSKILIRDMAMHSVLFEGGDILHYFYEGKLEGFTHFLVAHFPLSNGNSAVLI